MAADPDWISIAAIVLGPILAVQASEWLHRSRFAMERKIEIFKTLMSTRALNLSPQHVEALNLIDIEYDKRDSKNKDIHASWKAYLNHLGTSAKEMPDGMWGVRRVDLFVNLLSAMALRLGYDFDKTDISNTAYFPVGHGDLEKDQFIIRKGLAEILENKGALSIRIVPGTEPISAAEQSEPQQ